MSSSICEEKSGFLFKHACAYAASETCEQCLKGICIRHVRDYEGRRVCISCSKRIGLQSGHQPYYDDSYGYAGSHYSGYGHYRSGLWGGLLYGQFRGHDRNDLTEADSQNLTSEGDEAFEQDMGES